MPPNTTKDWKLTVGEATGEIYKAQSMSAGSMADANANMVRRVFHGQGPDKDERDLARGARVAVNIAAVHVPAFCSAGVTAYKNTYDLGETRLLGNIPAGDPIPVRTLVDGILATITSVSAKNIYFGAVEVNGSGIRFYGDVCFILKSEKVDAQTVVLDSNSYDLVRPPITLAGQAPVANNLECHAQAKAGLWADDTPDMAVLKTMAVRNIAERRLTTGQISDSVLDDEDYLEVLMVGSFGVGDLEEARTFAADAAGQGQISEQLRLGPCPTLAELQWRKHRLAAVRALQKHGVRSRVVTTSGRVR